jgi:hypothetical protein
MLKYMSQEQLRNNTDLKKYQIRSSKFVNLPHKKKVKENIKDCEKKINQTNKTNKTNSKNKLRMMKNSNKNGRKELKNIRLKEMPKNKKMMMKRKTEQEMKNIKHCIKDLIEKTKLMLKTKLIMPDGVKLPKIDKKSTHKEINRLKKLKMITPDGVKLLKREKKISREEPRESIKTILLKKLFVIDSYIILTK